MNLGISLFNLSQLAKNQNQVAFGRKEEPVRPKQALTGDVLELHTADSKSPYDHPNDFVVPSPPPVYDEEENPEEDNCVVHCHKVAAPVPHKPNLADLEDETGSDNDRDHGYVETLCVGECK